MNTETKKSNGRLHRPIVTLLVLLLPQLLIAAFITWRGTDPNDYFLAIEDKHRLAASLNDQPNLLLAGGSSVAWGSDSETYTEICGLPCVNLAINAGQGIDYRFNEALKFSSPGDIIVLTLEYYELTSKPSGIISTRTFAQVPSTIPLGRFPEFRSVFDSGIYEFLARRTRATATAGSDGTRGLYAWQNFNEAGDFVGHHGRKPDGKDNWGLSMPSKTDRAFQKLKRFVQAAKAKDVEVYYRLPCVPKSLAEEKMDRLRKIEAEFKSVFQKRMLNELDETLLPDDSFFDTSYHLIESEKLRVTRKLANRLQQKRE